jgi:23S rRNA (uracil1939-C5)-methyltransferase
MIRVINNKIMISVTAEEDDINIKNIQCDSLYINSKLIKGSEYLIDEVNGFKFSVYPDSFYQVNHSSMIKLYNKILDYSINGYSLLDLYCGTGTIGIWVKAKFRKITGVELNKAAIKNANINKELNGINKIEFICKDAKYIEGKYNTIIVDPPRSGLTSDVIEYLNYSETQNIIYVSCNPNTLKRDIAKLTNYNLKDISACDMFPRTKHVECVCVLELK